MDLSAVILNTMAATVSMAIGHYCWNIGKKTAFPQHWKRITLGFYLIGGGQFLFALVNVTSSILGWLKDTALTITWAGFLLILWGTHLFSKVADQFRRR